MRTPDPQIRSLVLYPAELRALRGPTPRPIAAPELRSDRATHRPLDLSDLQDAGPDAGRELKLRFIGDVAALIAEILDGALGSEAVAGVLVVAVALDPKRLAVLRARRRRSQGCRKDEYRSEERRVGKECRSRWSPYH